MFDLTQATVEWRRQMAAGGVADPGVLDELEGHLLEAAQRLIRAGKPEAEAFRLALAELGSPADLANEYKKLDAVAARQWWPVRAAWLMGALGAAGLGVVLVSEVRAGKTSLLLAAHVLSVTLGYGTMFLIGGLGICHVCTRAFRDLMPAQRQALQHSSLRLAGLAAGCTAIGTVLGMVWAKENWGRYWAWDIKETGAFLVLVWAVLMTVEFREPGVRQETLDRMAIIGNIVTFWAWFGTVTRGLHDYGFPNQTVVSAFFVLQAGFLVASLLPTQCLRGRAAR